jgi:hypothetical protein
MNEEKKSYSSNELSPVYEISAGSLILGVLGRLCIHIVEEGLLLPFGQGITQSK